VPSPKGGEERAFDLRALIELVRNRIEENRVTHPDSVVAVPVGQRERPPRRGPRRRSRRSRRARPEARLCDARARGRRAEIAELKFLLNHAVSSGGVTMGYLHPSLEHLRGWQDKATARLPAGIGLPQMTPPCSRDS
jgi:hypothetical protein